MSGAKYHGAYNLLPHDYSKAMYLIDHYCKLMMEEKRFDALNLKDLYEYCSERRDLSD